VTAGLVVSLSVELVAAGGAASAAAAAVLLSGRPARGRLPPAVADAAGHDDADLHPEDGHGAAAARPSQGLSSPSGSVPGGLVDGRHDLLRLTAASAAAAAVWTLVPGGWGLLAAGVAAVVTWRRSSTWEPAAAKRRRLLLENELPWLVDLMGSALRAGLGPVEAVLRVAEVSRPDVRRELQVPLARLRLGVDPVTVWGELAGHPQLGRLGVALRRATESGAPVVDALDRLAEDLRAGRRTAVQVRVRRIEVRAALPLGACFLPAFVLLAVVPLVAGSASRLLGG
jgi:Flp pilus assembly protein TadB